jgi:hypothetical protein
MISSGCAKRGTIPAPLWRDGEMIWTHDIPNRSISKCSNATFSNNCTVTPDLSAMCQNNRTSNYDKSSGWYITFYELRRQSRILNIMVVKRILNFSFMSTWSNARNSEHSIRPFKDKPRSYDYVFAKASTSTEILFTCRSSYTVISMTVVCCCGDGNIHWLMYKQGVGETKWRVISAIRVLWTAG